PRPRPLAADLGHRGLVDADDGDGERGLARRLRDRERIEAAALDELPGVRQRYEREDEEDDRGQRRQDARGRSGLTLEHARNLRSGSSGLYRIRPRFPSSRD